MDVQKFLKSFSSDVCLTPNWMSQISVRIPKESHPTGKTVTWNVRWRRFCSYCKIEIFLKETSCRRTLFEENWRLSALSKFSTSMIEVVLTTSSPTLVKTSPLPNAAILRPWAHLSAAKPAPFRSSARGDWHRSDFLQRISSTRTWELVSVFDDLLHVIQVMIPSSSGLPHTDGTRHRRILMQIVSVEADQSVNDRAWVIQS